MKQADAEKLLGGYAAGILSDAERQALFAAALAHQDLFDALMDEEALRELLADPAVKAQLLAALAPAAPKVIPFWRHPGLLSAAAGIILASVAGLAYLRSPETPALPAAQAMAEPAQVQPQVPPQASTPRAPQAKAKTPITPRLAQVPEPKAFSYSPAKADGALVSPAEAKPSTPARPEAAHRAAAVYAAEAMARERVATDARRMEARDQVAKQAEAPRPTAIMEAVGALAPPPKAAKVLGSAAGGVGPAAVSTVTPAWALEPQPDGSTRVTVQAALGLQAVLLKRGASGVAVLRLQASEDRRNALVQWRCLVRVKEGEVLDLYLLEHPASDPAQLPESGPVDGFRARIHPAAK